MIVCTHFTFESKSLQHVTSDNSFTIYFTIGLIETTYQYTAINYWSCEEFALSVLIVKAVTLFVVRFYPFQTHRS